MVFNEKPVKAGKVIKAQGIHGSVLVWLSDGMDVTDEWPEWCFVMIDHALVPFRLDQEHCFLRDNKHMVLRMQAMSSPEDCQVLLNRDLYLPEEVLGNSGSVSDLPDFSGYSFLLEGLEGEGAFAGYLRIPSNDLLLLDWQGRELMIPFRPEFLISVDERAKQVRLRLPEGLTDLN